MPRSMAGCFNIDANEIRQLLLNLTLNGLEAMQAGGNLFIRTFLEDNKVVLAVEDQGSGIDPSVYDKLGTPFVTTKETGTGLGLAICYSIAARHNATMGVDTGPKGTTFKVAFKINHKEKFSFPLVSVGN
jgi:signal transduction histidine kinase